MRMGKDDISRPDPIVRIVRIHTNIVVSQSDPLVTGDGQILKSFTFFPKEKGNWEQVLYGEEGDFYLIFTVSSRTKEGFTKALGIYKQFINQYKEKP